MKIDEVYFFRITDGRISGLWGLEGTWTLMPQLAGQPRARRARLTQRHPTSKVTMHRIPIYDATAPIACTIGADEIPDRIELVERIRTNLTTIERTPDGLLVHLPATPSNRDDLERFAIDEKRCCQFRGFAVTLGRDRHTLRWDGPPDAQALLDRLRRYFTGNEPVTDLAGLM